MVTLGLDAVYTNKLRWSKCFHTQRIGDETTIWMEYILGSSGKPLSIEMLELAEQEFGRLHQNPQVLQAIECLEDIGFWPRAHDQWHENTSR